MSNSFVTLSRGEKLERQIGACEPSYNVIYEAEISVFWIILPSAYSVQVIVTWLSSGSRQISDSEACIM